MMAMKGMLGEKKIEKYMYSTSASVIALQLRVHHRTTELEETSSSSALPFNSGSAMRGATTASLADDSAALA